MPELRLEHSLVDGRYEVYERLNRGSYAEIFVAYDRDATRAPVVIKALNTSLQGTPDPDLERTLVENFQNEAIALDAVRHPHVILRTGHGTAADLRGVPFHYLVLEYMPGGDLLELCLHRPTRALPLDEALFYFHQACEALSYAHSKGVIHRDLKPNNFLLSADKRTLKIADFGVAKMTTGETLEITRVGADVYAPPEHNPNENSADPQQLTTAADVYSLAKSFYTVVCGKPPAKFRCAPILSLPEPLMAQPWAKALVDVLCHATKDSPKARYATVSEFWHELAQVAVHAPTVNIEDLPSEETIVRPRLSVHGQTLPKTPVMPAFDPTPATSQLQESVAPATPVETQSLVVPKEVTPVNGDSEHHLGPGNVTNPVDARPARQADRPGKIFIDLQPQQAVPIATATAPQPLQQRRPPPLDKRAPVKPLAKTYSPPIASKFSEKIRRRVFIVFLVGAFAGLLVSVYNTFRAGTFGAPREIEVVSEQLNIRERPGSKTVLGVVAKGSRHHVITQNEQGWMQIEVSQWMSMTPGVSADTKQGWINGNPDFVKVVSRRWW
ncbi:MAG: serine/threonine-protein kinase [Acidobacteriota bacterium]